MSSSDESFPWEILKNYKLLLELLTNVAGRESLLVIDMFWRGCPSCSRPPSAFGQALIDFARRHEDLDWVSTHALHWRINENDNDLASPVSGTYKLFLELTAREKQYYGGGVPVENYTCNPPNYRVHFPQLFFLDARKINPDAIEILKDLDSDDRLFRYVSTRLRQLPFEISEFLGASPQTPGIF